MDYDLIVTLLVLGGAVALLASNRLRPDLIALLVVVVLGTTGVLSAEQVFSGFSRSAVIAILAIYIVAEGLKRAGVTAVVGAWLERAGGGKEGRLVVVSMMAGALLSLVMNNIAAAAVLLPGASAAAERARVCPSRLLMPMAFGTLLGGMATLLTTTNIVISSLLSDRGIEGFGLLDFAPIGLPLVAVGVVYMAAYGRRRLPALSMAQRLPSASQDLVDLYDLDRRLFRARVPAGSRLIGRPLAGSALREIYNVTVVAIERGDDTQPSPAPSTLVEEDDVLVIQGDLEDFRGRDIEPYLQILPPREWTEKDLRSTRTVVVEAVLAPRSSLVGKTLRNTHFRSKYGMNVLAVWRGNAPVVDQIAEVTLELGDALLLQGPHGRLEILRDEPDLIVLGLERVGQPPPQPGRRALALVITVATLITAAATSLSTGEVMLAGALAMVLAGLLTMDEAYNAVEWRTIFLVAGMLPLGIALAESGAAAMFANWMLAVVGPLGPRAIVAGLFLLTTLLVQVMSGPVVAVVMAPIAINTATRAGLDPRSVAMAVALATSMAFASPLGHPVNLLVMGSGGYGFRDYWRVGVPLTMLLFLVVVLLLPVAWPLRA